MRSIDPTIKARLRQAQQTLYNNANPGLILWISRRYIPAIDDSFVERQLIGEYAGLSQSSIALRHLNLKREPDRIYVGYVANSVAHVKRADAVSLMDSHIWEDTGFSTSATDIAVAFDGTMPKDNQGRIEFITESEPWIFWVDAGAVYGQIGSDSSTRINLASDNATRVSAVRAMWSDVGGFDFGLVLFMIIGGAIYYRQLIQNVWYDAAPVSFGPVVNSWIDIAAARTWDYRIVLQARDSAGKVWELFTQFEGIGKQNTEHLNVDVAATGTLTEIEYYNTINADNIGVAVAATGTILYGLSSAPVSARNVDDGSGDWGKTIEVTLDYPVSGVGGQHGNFTITDTVFLSLAGQSIELSDDGLTLIIGFVDFNIAHGDITLQYTPGTIQSPATAMTAWSISFTPTGLVPPQIDPPAVVEVTNI